MEHRAQPTNRRRCSICIPPLGVRRRSHRQRADRVQEVRVGVDRLVQHLDLQVAAQHLLPQDAQLQLGQAVAQAAMDAEAERHVLARPLAIDDELVRLLDLLLVAVARDVPDHHLVAGLDLLAADLGVLQRGAAHVDHRRLPADDLRDRAGDQIRDSRAASGTDRGSGSAPAARRTSSCASCRCRRPGTGSGCPCAGAASSCWSPRRAPGSRSRRSSSASWRAPPRSRSCVRRSASARRNALPRTAPAHRAR